MRGIILGVIWVGMLGAIFAAGCGDREDHSTWRVVSPDRMTRAARAQQRKAKEAQQALFANLAATLQTQIRREGLASAIGVCRSEAPRLAKEIAGERGLRIGRTSFKLRNPENAPPEWARKFIEKRVDAPRYLEGPGGKLGALIPIHLRPKCLKCHGDPDKVDPGVRKKIQETYPNDRAMGFSSDELRGWFWVEVPK